MAELKPYRGNYYLWKYLPSMVAAIIFIIIFSVMLGAHTWRMYRTRSWFCVPFTLGVLFEFIGYCTRAGARDKTDLIMPYVIQSLFILLAPALFAASIYMTLGRLMINIRASHLSFIPVVWLTRLFVTGDIMSFVVQGGSAPLMFLNEGQYSKWGDVLVISGLAIQILMFGLFTATAILFHRRIKNNPTPESLSSDQQWVKTMRMLYYVSGLIMFRSIFRLVEYIQGQEGYLLRHEWANYVFDGVPMFVVTVIFLVWYPSNLLAVSWRDSQEPHSELREMTK